MSSTHHSRNSSAQAYTSPVLGVLPRVCCRSCECHPHRTQPAEVREPLAVPDVHWNDCIPRDADGDHCAVVPVGRGQETTMTVAHVVPMKGADMEWVTEQAARDLLRFGIHADVILKSDQEVGH